MLKIKHSQLNWLGAGITLAIMSAMSTPAFAQRIIIINGASRVSQPPAVGSFIYGSPIPTPMPVDPATGLIPSRNSHYHSYPTVNNSRLIKPTLINPIIRDSTLVNPVIINNSRHHTPFRGRSRVIINNSRYHTPSRGRRW
ncbi:MAG: hypothetical protein AB3A66_23840 [Nodularia sp. CChRGM 3473]